MKRFGCKQAIRKGSFFYKKEFGDSFNRYIILPRRYADIELRILREEGISMDKKHLLAGAALLVAGMLFAPPMTNSLEVISTSSQQGIEDVSLAKEELILDHPVFDESIIDDDGVPLASPDSGAQGVAGDKKVSPKGEKKHEKNGSVIDTTDIGNGYVYIKNDSSKKRLKVQIIKGNSTYNYDLKNGGVYEIFPLQLGDGSYKIRIMENTSGNKYIPLFEKTLDVKLNNSLSPFLNPNQFVMYNNNWRIVQKASELTKGKATEVEKIAAIYDYIIKNVRYDKVKASTVQSGYLPNIDETLTSKKGICFDYAALLAGMLRSQGIPTRLIVGTVSPSDINHAWNEVYLKDKGWVSVKIQFEGSTWNRMDSTFASSGNEGIENFIGNGSNYTGLRLY